MATEQEQLLLLNERETARRLAISAALLRKWRRLGEGPQYVRLGRVIRYDCKTVEEYVRAHAVALTTER
jgi:predicted DNA-binding transcriptional regulator AlpA